ncbi:MAG: hypothetical protein O4861_19560 [Trichodesmium sp. St16_bin4-tuft]|nr:hypothetical protein [Trichodesmium sp. St4_bin8_1]MDE5071685.1 hypothetical protein [Trichodesmium sp. St5_bin8]MDE5077845.1 hypothetical protein [Trichodesmium sp. St2_bin6]MDE5100405.1 hypothetical protein [Trichodesmium sp. St16_bin4-tuft]MDE5101959.1 hypothetical protein [Trichodesmium sp. St19_bin2]
MSQEALLRSHNISLRTYAKTPYIATTNLGNHLKNYSDRLKITLVTSQGKGKIVKGSLCIGQK